MGLFNIKPSGKDSLSERFDDAVGKYRDIFGEELNTVTMFATEKTVADIEWCVKERIRLEEIWPELKDIRDEDEL